MLTFVRWSIEVPKKAPALVPIFETAVKRCRSNKFYECLEECEEEEEGSSTC